MYTRSEKASRRGTLARKDPTLYALARLLGDINAVRRGPVTGWYGRAKVAGSIEPPAEHEERKACRLVGDSLARSGPRLR